MSGARYASLAGVAALIGLALRCGNVDNVASRTPDERVYTRQANAFLRSGRSGVRQLAEEYRRDSTTRLYPAPTRAGMIALVGAAMRWTGRHDELAGVYVSLAAAICSMILLAGIAMRLMQPFAAAVSVVLYSTFPPSLAIARRAWSDSLTELVGLLLVALTCEITRNPRRTSVQVLFVGVGSAGMTIKEAMVVPYATCAAWVLWRVVKSRDRQSLRTLLAGAVAGSALVGAWLSYMVGGLNDLLWIVLNIPDANARNAYALIHASGPGHLLLEAFWITSPLVLVLAGAGLVRAITLVRGDEANAPALMFVALFTVANLAAAMVIPHWLNLRYVAVAFAPMCLIGGSGAAATKLLVQNRFSGEKGRRFVAATAFVLLAGLAVGEYTRFRSIFIENGAADLSIGLLRTQQDR